MVVGGEHGSLEMLSRFLLRRGGLQLRRLSGTPNKDTAANEVRLTALNSQRVMESAPLLTFLFVFAAALVKGGEYIGKLNAQEDMIKAQEKVLSAQDKVNSALREEVDAKMREMNNKIDSLKPKPRGWFS